FGDGMTLLRTVLALAFAATAAIGAEKVAPDWVKVTDSAQWQARDSQGEVVFDDKLWILGGWFDSYKPAPRDVWNTSDGKNWNLVPRRAPWKHSALPMSLVHGGRMWMLGGWYNGRMPGHEAGNEVWSSTGGTDWEQATASAEWSPRLAAAAVT